MKRNISKGTPEQLLNLVQNKIAELGGDVEACDTISAARGSTQRKFVNQFLQEFNIPKEYVRVVSGPKSMWWASVPENCYYVTVRGALYASDRNAYERVRDLIWHSREHKSTLDRLHVVNYTDDTVGYGLYSGNDNLGFIIEKCTLAEHDVEACDKITASSETTYQDTNGIMGEIGDTWTVSELRQYWDAEQMNDPVLSEYDSFESWLEDTTSHMTLSYEEDAGHSVLAAKNSADINNAKRELQQAVSNITDGQSLSSIANEMSGLLKSSIEEFKMAYEDHDNASTENISVQRVYAKKAASVLQIYEDLIKSFKKPNNFYQSCSAIASAIRKIAENFELDALSSIRDYGPMMKELDKLESTDKIEKKLKLELFKQYYKNLVYMLTNDLNMFKKKPKESLFSSTTIKANVEDSTYDDRFLHTLMGDIESEVSGEVDGLTFDTLENALNVTVVHGGEVTQFTVPYEDLSFDFDTMSDDVDYIVNTIKRNVYSANAINASTEDLLDREALSCLLDRATEEIPYYLSDTEAKFRKLAREFIQKGLVSDYGYSEKYVKSRNVVDQISEYIDDCEGMVW